MRKLFCMNQNFNGVYKIININFLKLFQVQK
jgi:hypothetical protein